MRNKKAFKIYFDAILLSLLIICSQISIQVGLIKITLQLLMIYLISLICDVKHSMLILTLYILMGLIGIPVFASLGGGFAYIINPTFGFVYGFYFIIPIINIAKKLRKNNEYDIIYIFIASLISLIILYLCGYIHNHLILNLLDKNNYDLIYLLSVTIIPYIPFDLIKIIVAIIIYLKIIPYIEKRNLQFHFKSIDSTSHYLKRNYKSFDNMTFVSTDYQKSGHGRMTRKWISNANENLMFSFLIKDENLIKEYSSISIAIAVAIYNALKKIKLKDISIKWPNDVYIKNKKICGILLESITDDDKLQCLIVGIGININSSFNDELKEKATSYYLETNKTISIIKVKRIVYRSIYKILNDIKNGKKNYIDIANEHNYLKNKEVYAEYLNQKVKVKVLNINQDNTLKVLLDNKEIDIFTGEITFHV